MTQTVTKNSLLANIGSVTTRYKAGALIELRAIARMIETAAPTLTRLDVIEVKAAFSSAFLPIGIEPSWVSDLYRVMDRVERPPENTTAARESMVIGFAEFTPRPPSTAA